ncbi:MAG TPA: flagellar filament capping protein FliD [Polyangiaceae bacterium]|nr:flagellar filament capping protein FliD [Polyangiaceae bacterium]
MATGTIAFGGVGSGLDTTSIVNGLVQASQGPLTALQTKQTNLQAANTSISSIGTLLGTLQTALQSVDETREVGSYAATSSSSSIVATANGAALPGTYSVSVGSLASEQRTYSDPQASSTTALGQSGQLSIAVGNTNANIDISSSDTLEDIASKINGSGLRVSASVINDGNQYRLQVRGLDTGAANAITFSGTTLGLDTAANTKQAAADAKVTIDDITFSRPTNQISGAIPGVTLNLTSPTTTPTTVQIASDPTGLQNKLTAVVNAYNAVIDAVHNAAGFGTTPAAVTGLAGDSMLRSLTDQMSNAIGTVVGNGQYQTLGSIGVSLDTNGHMSLDTDKLSTALQNDPNAVAAVIAGPTDGTGAVNVLENVVNTFNQTGTGLFASRETSMQQDLTDLGSEIDTEQQRLNDYADQLKAQFTQLDTLMSGTSQDMSYLSSFFGTTSTSK